MVHALSIHMQLRFSSLQVIPFGIHHLIDLEPHWIILIGIHSLWSLFTYTTPMGGQYLASSFASHLFSSGHAGVHFLVRLKGWKLYKGDNYFIKSVHQARVLNSGPPSSSESDLHRSITWPPYFNL